MKHRLRDLTNVLHRPVETAAISGRPVVQQRDAWVFYLPVPEYTIIFYRLLVVCKHWATLPKGMRAKSPA